MNTLRLLALCAVVALLATQGHASGRGCARCGCQSSCQTVCHVVCEMKEVVKVKYGCKCEDFCVPGKSTKVESCCDDPCCQGHTTWIPGCAKVYTRKVLVKQEEKIKKPVYKWVVEDLCPHCAASCRMTMPKQ